MNIKDYEGKEFKTIQAMCIFHGVKQCTYISRLKRGLTQEQALMKKSHTCERKVVLYYDYEGNSFSTLNSMLQYHEVTYAHYKKKLNEGYSLKDALTPKFVTDHKGNIFHTRGEMASFWGINEKTFSRRRNKNWSLERSLTGKVHSLNKECKDYLGNSFHSIQKMCEYYNITYMLYYMRKRQGLSLEECLKPKQYRFLEVA